MSHSVPFRGLGAPWVGSGHAQVTLVRGPLPRLLDHLHGHDGRRGEGELRGPGHVPGGGVAQADDGTAAALDDLEADVGQQVGGGDDAENLEGGLHDCSLVLFDTSVSNQTIY